MAKSRGIWSGDTFAPSSQLSEAETPLRRLPPKTQGSLPPRSVTLSPALSHPAPLQLLVLGLASWEEQTLGFRFVPSAACTQASVLVTWGPPSSAQTLLVEEALPWTWHAENTGPYSPSPSCELVAPCQTAACPRPSPPPSHTHMRAAPRTKVSLREKLVTAQCHSSGSQVCEGGGGAGAGYKTNRSFVFPKELASFTMGPGEFQPEGSLRNSGGRC